MLPLTGPADTVNRALQFIGGFDNNGPVTGVPPTFDGTPNGLAAGQLYDGVVQTVGRQFGWDFSLNLATLLLTGSPGQLGFSLEYIYPTSGIQVRQLVPPTIADPLDPRPLLWKIGSSLGGTTQATGSIFFGSNPTNGQTMTINGRVFTFVTSGGWPSISNYEINIGASAGGTVFFFLDAMTNSATYLADSALNVATYGDTGGNLTDYLTIKYKVPGSAGNGFTLAASNAVVSAPHLTGGTTTLQRVIWTNLASALAAISGQPPEPAWDALFTEAVVRLLASELDLATAGKPESSAAGLESAGAFSQLGQQRSDS